MPLYTPESLTREIIKKRHSITNSDKLRKISLFLFDLAIRNKDAAEALLEQPHRLLGVIASNSSEEKLLQFARANSPKLVEKFISYTTLNSDLANKMRHAASNKPQNNEFNAFLQDVRSRRPQMPRQDGRTFLAVRNNDQVIRINHIEGVYIDGKFTPIVDRGTRDFNKRLCSVGVSSKREILLLDPQDKVLQDLYAKLKWQLRHASNPREILEIIKNLTQTCFPGGQPDEFIARKLRSDKVISLSEFILQGQGVCRHHTLLNSYFLSRLVQDGLLHGEVIHHRQDFDRGAAHAWNLYRDRDGKVYSLDSLWNDVTCVTDNPGALNNLYRQHYLEGEINRMHFRGIPIEQKIQKQVISPPRPVNELFNNPRNMISPQGFEDWKLREKINQIKTDIENNVFEVGSYCFFQGGLTLTLDNGTEKRVPHRVYKIYEAIRKHGDYSESVEVLWAEIQKHAKDGFENPRQGQQEETTAFYSDIANFDESNENDHSLAYR
ncbi:hypothetical protein BN59_02084 [Legionella massiliensis]|uniref:Uncharacterized protein n=1 Tax=Legionella massiliensis TaxID=1034943 RepID=A0A078L177_9GAMM|nr:hypothetical protein [Legionella massiliensis]CDZ77794.1 hypothetical protein BN59_02084 [Legionella massiliensis]CEE13532.1 hypothetical protein BN1094_02084 [Legionella massiliensis]